MVPIFLVVDGDSSNCAEWESLLQSQGCDVIAARTGETAVALCPKLQPDLVLLRDLLPDVHGLEVCRRLKADPARSRAHGPGFWSLDQGGRFCGRVLDPDPSELGPSVRA